MQVTPKKSRGKPEMKPKKKKAHSRGQRRERKAGEHGREGRSGFRGRGENFTKGNYLIIYWKKRQ